MQNIFTESSIYCKNFDKSRQNLKLVNTFSKCKLNILGIVDHKIVHKDDPTETEIADNCTLITFSAGRKIKVAAAGWVGILVDNESEKALEEIKSIKPINKRIMTVVFNDNPITTVVVNYLIVKEVRGQRTLQNADKCDKQYSKTKYN